MLGVNHSLTSPNKAGTDALIRDYKFLKAGGSSIADVHQDIEFSRGAGTGGATQTNSSGLVAYAPHNLIPYSENFAHTDWVKYNASAAASSEIDPFGGTGAYKFAEASTASNSKLMLDCFATSGSGTIYTWSVYAKKAELDILQLILTNVTYAGGDNHANFDLTNGAVTATGGGATAKIEAVGTDGWYRCSMTDTTSASGETCPRIGLQNSGTAARDGAYAGNGTDGIFIFGAQGEKTINTDDSPTTYNITTGSAYQAPRFDYDKDGNSKGLLVEEQRVNLQTQAINLSGNYTLIDSSSWVADATVSPSGLKDADRLYEGTSPNGNRINYTASTSANTLSFYAKKGALRDWVYSYIWTGSAIAEKAFFNLATGQVGTTDGVGATGMEDVGNGWYRCWVYRSTAGYAAGRIGIADADDDIDYTGDISAYVSLWGIQEEAASFPSSLIPTYGAAATRAADLVSVTGTNFSRWYKQSQGTIVMDAQVQKGWKSGTWDRLYQVDDGSTGNSIRLTSSAGNEFFYGYSSSDLSGGDLDIPSTSGDIISGGEIFRTGLGIKQDDFAYSFDGNTIRTDTSVDLPVDADRIRLGSLDGSTPWTGWIRRFRYYNKRQPNTKLQSLTDSSFLLDKYKGAKAAHSLRSLRGGRDASPVCTVRRDYDSAERSFTANEISDGTLSDYHTSSKQTTLPLDVSCDAVEMVVGGDFTELVTNGGFDADSNWTKQSGWSIGSGVASVDSSTAGATMLTSTGMTVEVGKTYTVTYTINSVSGSGIRSTLGGVVEGSYITSAGTFSHTVTATTTTGLIFTATSNDTTGVVDNVSVVEGGWTLGTGWTTGNGIATHAAGTSSNLDQAFVFQNGKTYDITCDVLALSGGSAFIEARGSGSTVSFQLALGANTFSYTDNDDHTTLRISAGSGTTMSIDNISIKEVSPLATGFSTRKINSSYTGKAMRCRNQSNVEVEVGFDDNDQISLLSPITNTSQNLLAHSNNFNHTDWDTHAHMTSNAAVSPTGAMNASEINGTSAIYDSLGGTLSNITISIYAKKNTTDFLTLSGGNPTALSATFDLTDGTVAQTVGASNPQVSDEGNGWYRCSVRVATGNYIQFSARATGAYNGTLVGGVYVYGAQVEDTLYESTGTDVTLDGTFSNGYSNWASTNAILVSIANNFANYATDSTQGVQQSNRLTLGKKYKVTFTISDYVSGGVKVRHPFLGNFKSANGTYIVEGVADSDDLYFQSNGATTLKLSDIEVLEYDPELSSYSQTPAIADDDSSTTATTLGGFAGNENLVTHSEDITNYWGLQSAYRTADVTFAPDGVSATADLVYPASTGSGRGLVKNLGTTLEAGKEYTLSAYLKKDGYSHAKFQGLLNNVGSSAWFDLENGVVSSVAGGGITQTSISWAGNNWWRCSFTITASGTGAGDYLYIQTADANGTETSTASGSSGMYVWGCQLNSKAVSDLSQLYYEPTSGTAKTADCMVVNWYDQNGGEDFVQSVAADQPRIVMGSELVTDSGGKASLYFDASDHLDNKSLGGQQRLDGYFVTDITDDHYVLLSDSTGSRAAYNVEDGDTVNPAIHASYGTPNIYVNGTAVSGTSRDALYEDSTGHSLVTTDNATTATWGEISIGGNWQGLVLVGKVSELVFFPNMDSSPKRFPIEQNMLNHFGVNFVGNGGFDTDTLWTKNADWTISGGTANSDGSGVGRVYQHAGITAGKTYKVDIEVISITSGTVDLQFYDGSFQTITSGLALGTSTHSFTVPSASSPNGYFYVKSNSFVGSIDNVSIKEYGTDGYLTTLYDQTGNNCHATQDTASYQPQLVSGGDVITSGGKPAFEFTQTSPSYSNLEMNGINAARLDAWFVADTSSTQYIYPSAYNNGGKHGWITEDGDSNINAHLDYGGEPVRLYANGTLVGGYDITRDAVHTGLNGRKLVHHQDADTEDWSTIEVGWYGEGPVVGGHIPWSYEGKMSEMIWYDSDQSSNRTAIDSAINSYYSIY